MGDRLIGVDVGGTKVSVAVLEDGVLSEPVLRPTILSSSDALVDQLVEAIEDAGPADAVGIGVPSVIDFATGTARSSVNIPLQGVPLRQLLSDRVGIPAFVDNDATVAALAEAHDDDLNLIAGSLVMITVGTGVGGGIVIDGRIYRGATGAAPELGHIIVAADLTDGAPPRAERQPHHASLEYMAAGRALDRLGEARGLGNGTAVVAAARNGESAMRANACASSGNAWEWASPTSSTSSIPSSSSSAAGSRWPASCCSLRPRSRPPASSSRASARRPASSWPATARRRASGGPRCSQDRSWNDKGLPLQAEITKES